MAPGDATPVAPAAPPSGSTTGARPQVASREATPPPAAAEGDCDGSGGDDEQAEHTEHRAAADRQGDEDGDDDDRAPIGNGRPQQARADRR
jgi:hypothetical protein